MCGRFVSTTPPDQLAAYFGAGVLGESLLEPSYNVAPTNQVYAVVERPTEAVADTAADAEAGETDAGVDRVLDTFRWGLIPFWAKDHKIGSRMINARAETVATKNAFRKPFQRARCIIPADSFYEWIKIDGHEKKTPMRIVRTDGDPFAFAGLWGTWKNPDTGERIQSCTILTGTPNERIAKIHDRMPIILPPGAWDAWLDPELRDPEALEPFLVPAPAELMTFHPVSTDVNNGRARGAELITRVEVEGAPVAEDAA